jgi:hypothetical protein
LFSVPDAPPTEIEISQNTTNSVSVCWLPPSEESWNGKLIGCRVHYLTQAGNIVRSVSVNFTNSGITCAHVTDLETGEVFDFSVQCYNSAGAGPSSDTVQVRIAEGVPLLPASNVTVVAVSSTHVEVTFVPPAHSARRSTLRYRLLARKLKSQSAAVVKRSVADDDGLITVTGLLAGKNLEKVRVGGLRKFTSYEIVIICMTDAGEGPPSDPVTVQTLEDGNYNRCF